MATVSLTGRASGAGIEPGLGAVGGASVLQARAGASDAATDVKINESEPGGGAPGDWVDFNTAGAPPADISGFVFRDNDDTHNYVIPAGSIIPPGGYYLLE